MMKKDSGSPICLNPGINLLRFSHCQERFRISGAIPGFFHGAMQEGKIAVINREDLILSALDYCQLSLLFLD